VANDPFQERESDRLQSQLEGGCHLRIYHYGESPAYAFLPSKPTSATQVRHVLAESRLLAGDLLLVEKGWNFDVYRLAA
jgi:hypothetical protein